MKTRTWGGGELDFICLLAALSVDLFVSVWFAGGVAAGWAIAMVLSREREMVPHRLASQAQADASHGRTRGGTDRRNNRSTH